MSLDDILIWASEHQIVEEVYNVLDNASSSGEGLPSALRSDRYVGSAMVVGCACWLVRPNDSETLCWIWCETFLFEGREFRVKAVAARDHFM